MGPRAAGKGLSGACFGGVHFQWHRVSRVFANPVDDHLVFLPRRRRRAGKEGVLCVVRVFVFFAAAAAVVFVWCGGWGGGEGVGWW